MKNSVRKILPFVSRPGRYIGNEINSIHKENADVKIALAFPDVYEVGMSYLGFKILYEIINSRTDSLAERVYAPWPDMLEEMKKNDIPLFSLESCTSIRDFDIVGFTLQSELSYTNILLMLEHARINFLSSERDEREPLLIAGGPCGFNPEPLADIFDLFVIGDGEEVIHEIIEAYKKNKDKNRHELLKSFAAIQGIYVPSFYNVYYNTDGTIKEIGTHPIKRNIDGDVSPISVPDIIKKRIVHDFENIHASVKPPVPFINVIHDRLTLEIMRGCARNCKFCLAGSVYKPVRLRSIDTLIKQGKSGIKNTGYDEISLSSLNTADYKNIENLVTGFADTFHDDKVSISLPSLRVDLFSREVAEVIQKLRKPGLTFAPETGTEKLREYINKKITDEELINITRIISDLGWNLVKLYFMVGLPTENFSDVEGIVSLVRKIKDVGSARNKRMNVHVGVSPFVPKPHTQFQRQKMDSIENLKQKTDFLIKKFGRDVKWHNPKQSCIEGVFSRGDRRLTKVLITAYKLGCKFDAWNEYFNYDLWQKAFSECNIDPLFYVSREIKQDEILPWDLIKCVTN